VTEEKLRSDEFVCAECFGDQGMKDFCLAHGERDECDFCGATGTEPIAAPLDDVIEHINATIHRYYDDPANAGLPYESAEGGYQGETWYTYEIFDELGLDFPKDKGGRLQKAIDFGLDNDLWSEAEPFALSRDQILRFSWERFCRVVKHELRYFFMRETKKRGWPYDDELYSPAEILKTTFAFAETAGAFVPMPAGTKLFRARYQPAKKIYATAGTLGPPPEDHAIKTNRMSPPGVVMTYAAEDKDTALAETADEPGRFTNASASAPTVVGSERPISASIARCVVFRPLGASVVS
jgi:HEPN superfamily RES-like protein/RES domain-containing protein